MYYRLYCMLSGEEWFFKTEKAAKNFMRKLIKKWNADPGYTHNQRYIRELDFYIEDYF